jgi:hypothetical protein
VRAAALANNPELVRWMLDAVAACGAGDAGDRAAAASHAAATAFRAVLEMAKSNCARDQLAPRMPPDLVAALLEGGAVEPFIPLFVPPSDAPSDGGGGAGQVGAPVETRTESLYRTAPALVTQIIRYDVEFVCKAFVGLVEAAHADAAFALWSSELVPRFLERAEVDYGAAPDSGRTAEMDDPGYVDQLLSSLRIRVARDVSMSAYVASWNRAFAFCDEREPRRSGRCVCEAAIDAARLASWFSGDFWRFRWMRGAFFEDKLFKSAMDAFEFDDSRVLGLLNAFASSPPPSVQPRRGSGDKPVYTALTAAVARGRRPLALKIVSEFPEYFCRMDQACFDRMGDDLDAIARAFLNLHATSLLRHAKDLLF